MFSQWRIRNTSSWTMLLFGVAAFLLGLIGIISPSFMLSTLGLQVVEKAQRATYDYTLAFVTTSSMASFNMGIYYILAALSNWKTFYRWTVPFRMVTFTVFTLSVVSGNAPGSFIGVAAWELVGAITTGAALYHEQRRGIE